MGGLSIYMILEIGKCHGILSQCGWQPTLAQFISKNLEASYSATFPCVSNPYVLLAMEQIHAFNYSFQLHILPNVQHSLVSAITKFRWKGGPTISESSRVLYFTSILLPVSDSWVLLGKPDCNVHLLQYRALFS